MEPMPQITKNSSQKYTDGEEKIDRVSSLSDDILIQILSLLQTYHSVSTSILSRRWRFLWTHVPNLDFDSTNHRSPRGTLRFSNIITNVLSRHNPQTLNTFRLHQTYYCSNNDFERWIKTVINRNVRNIYIDLNLSDMLPRCLFTCETLVDLRLWHCGDIPMTGDVFLPALKKLHLCHVEFESDESIGHVLDGCPVLEELVVEKRNAHTICGYISSASLKRLMINSSNRYADKKTCVVELYAREPRYQPGKLTSLIEADVVFHAPVKMRDRYGDEVLGFLNRLCSVKCLKLSIALLERLPGSFFSDLAINFHNLTELELDADWRFIAFFLESAYNLEVLVIRMDAGSYLKKWMEEPKQVPACLLFHLRSVRMNYFWFTEQEFNMVRYILKNAKVLKRMEIHFKGEGTDLKQKLEAIKRISLFKRGYLECELAFD